MSKKWYYFGCGNGPGHYLYGENMSSVSLSMRRDDRVLSKLDRGLFDGLLAPLISPIKLYQATYNVLEGMGFVAVAWHDQSEDKRAGSNSIIFAPIERDILPTFHDVLEGGKIRFPRVFERLPQPLVRWSPRAD
jgi:hypothetical protein